MQLAVSQLINGIGLGMIDCLLAFGLTLIFGVMRFVNFAHGAFYCLGAYATYALASQGFDFFPAAIMGVLAVSVLAYLTETLLLSRIYRLAPYFHILVTFGLTLVIEEAVRLFWSAAPQRVETPAMLKGLSFIGPFFYPNYRLFVIGCACVCAAGLWFLLERTRFGARIRAGSENRDMVLLLGIDIDRLLTANFVLGAGLAALAGALVSPIRGVDPAMGTEALGTAFIVCVVGGLGSFRGAIVAALLVGIVQSYATSLWGAGAGIVAYLAMVAVLLARPEGLFGAAEAIAR